MKTNARVCASLCLGLAMVSLATAAPTIKIDGGPYQVGGGGEITATMGSSTFQTFCVELDEHIVLGHTYYAVVNTEAVNGGVGGGHPDPLDARSAWLFQQFTDGTLPDYAFSGTLAEHRDSAEALQDAIWYIENEIPSLPGGSLAAKFVGYAEDAEPQGIGDVRVLNLYGDEGLTENAQDVLGIFPPRVPVPGAILLGGLGCALVGFLRRRAA
jgi:hypothetical protein